MNFSELRATMIGGAAAYYNYLSENGKGLVQTPAASIRLVEKSDDAALYELTLSGGKRLNNADGIEFIIRDVRYQQSEVRVAALSKIGDKILVQPMNDTLKALFETLTAKEILVQSDLKFLVKRVEQWHTEHGDLLGRTPSLCLPPYRAPVQQIADIPVPSQKQAAALDMIFSHTFSYVQGAPGTGKTKCVLAFALLHCIAEGGAGKIIITAPTNNALDQTLFGILPVIQAYGFSELLIHRLGTPTTALYRDYPQICAYGGPDETMLALQEEIQKIDNELKRRTQFEAENSTAIKRQKLYSDFREALFRFCDTLYFVEESQKKKNEAAALTPQIKQAEISAKNAKEQLDKFNRSRHRLLEKISKKRKSEADANENNLRDRYEHYRLELEDLYAKQNALLAEAQSLNETAENEKISEQWKNLHAFEQREAFPDYLFVILNYIDRGEKADVLRRKMNMIPVPVVPKLPQDAETVDALNARREEYQQRITQIKNTHSTFESAKIIAGTLDAVIGHFSDFLPVPIEHVFIDEAAYAPLAKGIVVFSFGAPVTLLGDYMQLPPVCEMDDDEITKAHPEVVFWAQSMIHCKELSENSLFDILDHYTERKPPIFGDGEMTALNFTHRFGQNLAAVLAKWVYHDDFHGKAESGVIIQAVDCRSVKGTGTGRENRGEADAIAAYLLTNRPDNVAVLTPYKAQVKLLKHIVPAAYRDAVRTIHASQGQEYDTVLISVCDAENMYFTDCLNVKSNGKAVLNTAVSRAKNELILFCDVGFWQTQSLQLIKGLLDVAAEK